MVEISASVVMKLRQMSGQGMMDCKAALQDANGDMDKAMEILRKKGLATLAKRAERTTTEGIVVGKYASDNKTAVLASLCCETDFVANNDDFKAAAAKLADYALACSAAEGIDNILNTSCSGKILKDVITELVSKTGEKTEVGHYAKFNLTGPGLIVTYIHFNKKVGTMVQIETSDDKTASSEAVKAIASDIAMHITATNPLALDSSGIDPKVIEQEKAIYAEQVKNKPPQITEKIVQGKLDKFFADNCLLSQPFVKDNAKQVIEVLDEAAKLAGGKAVIKRYVRFAVG